MKSLYFTSDKNEYLDFYNAIKNALATYNEETIICYRYHPNEVAKIKIKNSSTIITLTYTVKTSDIENYINKFCPSSISQESRNKLKEEFHVIFRNGADQLERKQDEITYIFRHKQTIMCRNKIANLIQFISDSDEIQNFKNNFKNNEMNLVEEQINVARHITDKISHLHFVTCLHKIQEYIHQVKNH